MKFIWQVDGQHQLEAKSGFIRYKIYWDGELIPSKRTSKAMSAIYKFTLPDGREGELEFQPYGTGFNLRLNGKVILSEIQKKSMVCLKCGASLPPDAKFCEKCGAEAPNLDDQLRLLKLKKARNYIGFLSAIFLLSGIAFTGMAYDKNQKTLDQLSSYQDGDLFPKLLNGKQYTYGELRQEIQTETWNPLIVNSVLAAIMLGLFFYSKYSPLVAFLAAGGIYAAVIVVNAVMDPKTIGQGLVMKIIIITLLIGAIRSALELRKSGS
jgi:ribosomal protein L40E